MSTTFVISLRPGFSVCGERANIHFALFWDLSCSEFEVSKKQNKVMNYKSH